MEPHWCSEAAQDNTKHASQSGEASTVSRWHLFYLLYHDVWQPLQKKSLFFKFCFDKLMDGSLVSPHSLFFWEFPN